MDGAKEMEEMKRVNWGSRIASFCGILLEIVYDPSFPGAFYCAFRLLVLLGNNVAPPGMCLEFKFRVQAGGKRPIRFDRHHFGGPARSGLM